MSFFLPFVLASRLQEAREQEEAARMRHVDTKVLSIWMYFKQFYLDTSVFFGPLPGTNHPEHESENLSQFMQEYLTNLI